VAEPNSPPGVHHYRQDPSQLAFQECQQFLHGVGNYFLETPPSSIDNKYVLEVETQLHSFANTAYQARWPQASDIEACLEQASHLADIVKRSSGGPRGVEFNRTVRVLGQLLVLV
jgi:hypothetical protein